MIAFRVVDTATFIEAGRKVNGDFYDYSESVFSGYKNPILIGCNRCGKRVILKNAASHYMKGCGCQACNRDRLSPCKICGVNMSSKIYHKQGKRCDACREREKQNRLAVKEKKHGKHCKKCGVWFVDRDRFYCSEECRKSIVAKPVVFNCSHCGMESIRDPHKISNLDRMFCSRDCQTAFQRVRWSDYQSKGKEIFLPFIKAKAARKKWFSSRAQEKANSVKGRWFARCLVETKDAPKELSQWEKRCAAAMTSIAKRQVTQFGFRSVRIVGSWDRRIQLEKPRLHKKEKCEWKQRCETVSRNIRRRMAIRNNGRQQQINLWL